MYLSVDDISWDKYTAVHYGFAYVVTIFILTIPSHSVPSTPANDGSITLDPSDAELLPQFVQAAHQSVRIELFITPHVC